MIQPTPLFPRVAAFLGAVGLCLALATSALAQDADSNRLKTLRGAEVNAADPASEGIRFGPDTANIPRDFVQQPPLVPHTMDEYKVTKEFNKCLDCHSWARAKEMKATKISLTHFKNRTGAEMSNVSPNRYFCAQCHVPQSDAKPLIGNTFKPGKGLK